jgi:hypothetical protein
MKKTNFLSLWDVLTLAREHLVPREPVSLYRYVEFLVQLALMRKIRFRKVLETGPGTYPVFGVWPRDSYDSGTIVDYNEKVLRHCETLLAGKGIESLQLDFDGPGALGGTGRKWDLIVSNGVVEHLKNDGEHVADLHDALEEGGMLMCVTVMHESMFNDWDKAVGHYRRYSMGSLLALFEKYSEVQVIQTSMLQEIVRPLFFGRIRHLLKGTVEENNRLFGDEVTSFSKPPYSGIFGLVRWCLPVYLVVDWWFSKFLGGIVIVIAKK